MKILLMVFFALAGVVLSQAEPVPSDTRPVLAVLDLVSATYDPAKSKVLGDTVQAGAFHSNLFRVKEIGAVQKALEDLKVSGAPTDSQVLQAARALGLDEVLVLSVEKVGDVLALGLRIFDVATAQVEASESLQLKDESRLFYGLESLTDQAVRTWKSARARTTAGGTGPGLGGPWKDLGAEGADLVWLDSRALSPEDYLDLRQYDSAIDLKSYVEALRTGFDFGTARDFLRAGIPFAQVRQAFDLGLKKLDRYQSTFQPAGLSFAEFLEAFRVGLATPAEYQSYKKGLDADFLSLGLGGVADQIPIAEADFKYALGQVTWEHSWANSPRDWTKVNTEAGLILLGFFLPTPYFGVDLMVGQPPFYAKVGVGGLTELIVGGHMGVFYRLGLEVFHQYEFSFFSVVAGTQPTVSYGNITQSGGGDSLKFPYYGILFTYKIPLGN